MTKREAAIVSAYTGYLCGDFDNFHAYVESVAGHPVWTHEIPKILDDYHEKFKEDFCSMTIDGVEEVEEQGD